MENVAENTEVVTEVAPAVEPVAAPAPKVEKVQLFKIYVDENGTEIERKPLAKGRYPKGATKDETGNLIIKVAPTPDGTEVKFVPMIITLDESGNEISRTEKGRGRPAKGLVHQTDGDFKGHWVKTQKTEIAPVAVETPEVVATAPVEATEAIAETEISANPQ